MSTSTFRATIPTGPLVDPRTGRATQEWLVWFNQIFGRTGGAEGSNAVSVADSSATTQDQVTALQGTVTVQAAQIAALNTELAASANTITALQATVAATSDAALIALFLE